MRCVESKYWIRQTIDKLQCRKRRKRPFSKQRNALLKESFYGSTSVNIPAGVFDLLKVKFSMFFCTENFVKNSGI